MVSVIATATNSNDIYPRKWCMWADIQPAQNWYTTYGLVNDVPFQVEDHYSGDTETGEVDLEDGVHTIYFGIGDTGASGSYAGSINFDGILKTFSGFLASNIGGWQVNVKNNKVVSLITEPGSEFANIGSELKARALQAQAALMNLANKDWITANWPWLTLAVVIPLAAGGGIYYLKKQRRRV